MLESLDEIFSGINAGAMAAAEGIQRVLGAQIALRNARRLETANGVSCVAGSCARNEGHGDPVQWRFHLLF
ncbi:MAG: hypothetical protein ABW277_01870 [Longimicrobiaceae bacterium]